MKRPIPVICSLFGDVMAYSPETVKSRHLLEISVETMEGAAAAERGAADRIELCGDLAAEGVTPDAQVMRSVREMVRIPVFAMIRPRAGDFVFERTGR